MLWLNGQHQELQSNLKVFPQGSQTINHTIKPPFLNSCIKMSSGMQSKDYMKLPLLFYISYTV